MKTAVEWLEEKLDNLLELYPSQNEELTKLIQEAKEMEKSEKLNAQLTCLVKIYADVESLTDLMYKLHEEIKELERTKSE